MVERINISAVLKQLRKMSGYVARDVTKQLKAYGISISEKTLYGYESGLSMPNADTFVALCRIYHCDNPMDLLGPSGFDPGELELIRKYRGLDEHGKRIVTLIMKEETARRDTAPERPEIELIARGERVEQLDHRLDPAEIEQALIETPSET